MTTLSRRDLLKAGLAVGGGLLVEVSMPSARAATAAEAFVPNAFLRITSDDVVTFILSSTEMGQGVSTSFAQLLAEELGIDELRSILEKLTLLSEALTNVAPQGLTVSIEAARRGGRPDALPGTAPQSRPR